MQALTVVQQLLAAHSRIAKEKIILDAYAANCFEFFEARRLANDPFVVFGVERVAEILEDDHAVGTFSFANFLTLCRSLCTGSLSDEAGRLAIHEAAERCHVQTWNLLYRRVLLKDFNAAPSSIIDPILKRLGVDADRFRPPIFRCQTASTGTAATKALTGTRLVDVKLSGQRLLTLLDKNVTLRNSDGLVVDKACKLEQSLRPLATWLPVSMVLDGVLSASGEYLVFDFIPLEAFRTGLCLKSQSDRRTMLERLQESGGFADSKVRVLPQIEVDFATRDGQLAFTDFNARAISDGRMTVVVKKPDAHYSARRSNAWILRKASAYSVST